MTAGRRLISMFVDHLVLVIIIASLYPLLDKFSFQFYFLWTHDIDIWFIFAIFIYLNKDIFGGKSIAKRLFSLEVVNTKYLDKIANPLQCFLRNTLVIIWPLEIIVILVNPRKRIGDLLAGTEVHVRKKGLYRESRQSIGIILFTLFLSLLFSVFLNELFSLIDYYNYNMLHTPAWH